MRPHMQRLLLASVLALAAALACDHGRRSPVEPEAAVARVEVTPGVDTLAALGATRQFSAVAKDAQGNVLTGKPVTWQSSAPGVATVDASGLAVAVTDGEAKIRASVAGVSGEAALVVAQQVTTVTVTPGTASLATLGATQQYAAVAKDANGNTVPSVVFVWLSSDHNVATVDVSGLAHATGSGSVTIIAVGRGIPGTAALTVQLPPPTTFLLTVIRTGPGTVTSGPAGIYCGVDCDEAYASGRVVTLIPTADPGATFAGWSGACAGTGACTVTMDAAKSVSATFGTSPVPTFVLSVSRTGPGTVSSIPLGIYCGVACAASFASGTIVTLTPTPDPGATFSGWTGACAGTGACTVTMDAAKSVSAAFQASPVATFMLTVTKTGSGTVASTPVGIYCGVACTSSFSSGTVVTLTATADPGATFTGWGGECSGTAACTVTMDAAKSVSATFGSSPVPIFVLSVTRTGPGTVSSTPLGIYCGVACAASFARGTIVTLTPTPDPGAAFSGWTGACTGTGACTVTMDAAKSASATFQASPVATFKLTVTKAGNGTVVSAPVGIYCGVACASSFASGTAVTLTATPDPGVAFIGWSGACSGVGACSVTVDADKTVVATFASYSLHVAATGPGSVVSNPAGIDCGATCDASFPGGTLVTLTATPVPGFGFVGWGGACTGSAPCVVSMTANQTATATFGPLLMLTLGGTGRGTVTSTPAGLNCPSECSAVFPANTRVTLFATPAIGSLFGGWQGGCSGLGTCTVTLSVSETVTATFNVGSAILSVTKAGTGTGVVTSSPAGITCGADCSESYQGQTVVTLTATPDPGSQLVRLGPCGTSPCAVTMSVDRSVTATFGVSVRVTVALSGAGAGSVKSSPAGIDCGSDCFEDFGEGAVVTLTATPAAGSRFTQWTAGPCVGSTVSFCNFSVGSSAVSATAEFVQVPTSTVTVTRSGAGAGTVASSPTGIDCGTTCTASFGQGTSVGLTATAATGSAFDRWTAGPCLNSQVPTCFFVIGTSAVTATAKFEPPAFALTVTSVHGRVTAAGGGIDCGTDCTESYVSGHSVTLTALPDAGYYFAGWSGACTGTGSCVVIMDADKSVTASFLPKPTLQIVLQPTGPGFVFATSPSGTKCTESCTVQYSPGTLVTLGAATTDTGARFLGWSGACTGTDACTVTMDVSRSVTAEWGWNVVVKATGDGTPGRVRGLSSGECDFRLVRDCSAVYPDGTADTLRADLSTSSEIVAWLGCDSVPVSGPSPRPCFFTARAPRTITVEFLALYPLSVTKSGDGAGTVFSYPAGINCGSDCGQSYPSGTDVWLTAAPAVGSVFTGWSGACTGAGTCMLTLSNPFGKTVNARFAALYNLTVAKAGIGSGTVTSSPLGIDCGTDCSEDYVSGTAVGLHATPAAGWAFLGWSGACSGLATTCSVTMDKAQSVTATFGPGNTLTVAAGGSGGGFVGSTPEGISCSTTGGDCSETYAPGTIVTLTATASGSIFAGWSGACTGTATTCTVTMDVAKSVGATFTATFGLSVAKAGAGSGTVTSSPAGITCGTDCFETYVTGTTVILTAAPATGSTFGGWSGACTGTATICTVTMTAAKFVTATFN